MDKQTYLANPSGASALAYWKTNTVTVPDSVRVVADRDFSSELLEEFRDEPYFKLVHDLKNLAPVRLPQGFRLGTGTTADFADHIRSCYPDEGVTMDELEAYRKHPVYAEDLWICIYQPQGQMVASGIAEFDPEVNEGSLDWIQVSADWRGQGLGQCIVNELLHRLAAKADFVTVSGRLNNVTQPEKLYQRCGFGAETVWHVLVRK